MKNRWIDQIKFDAQGLIPAVIQDSRSRQVLMVAYMNRQAVLKTIKIGKAHFYSRSRKKIWLKGETSGHFQRVKQIALDCDGDALLVSVTQVSGACHAGYRSCFFRRLSKNSRWVVEGKRIFDPGKVYEVSQVSGVRSQE